MSRSLPTSEEISQLVDELNSRRAQLLDMLRDHEAGDDLVQAIDEIGAKLLVADEELRVQNEQLAMSARRLDLLAAADEELFANAPAAYLQTDIDGMIVRYNHAARRKLRLPARTTRSRTIASLVEPAHRSGLRSLITQARLEATAADLPPLECTLVRPDGTRVPAVFVLRRSGLEERALLHWEVQDINPPAPVASHGAADVDGPTRSTGQADALRAIADAAQKLATQDTPQRTMHAVAAQARAAIPGCDAAGITLERGHRRMPAAPSTDPIAARCDAIEVELGEGPCLDALAGNQLVNSSDVTTDPRWPRFGELAGALGVRSILAVPLEAPRGMFGALNLYSGIAHAFDEESELVASTYASHAAVAIMHAELESNLRVGLATREEIGRAVGILMERHRVTATAAFDMLVYASQRSHRKLRYVATWVNETGEDPDKILH